MMTFTKDPNAVLDYAIDWSKWLAGDQIPRACGLSATLRSKPRTKPIRRPRPPCGCRVGLWANRTR